MILPTPTIPTIKLNPSIRPKSIHDILKLPKTTTMTTRIPHLLAPYLQLPSSSLTLLTSVLGATTNWLLLRYLLHHLAPRTADDEEPQNLRRRGRTDDKGVGEGNTAIVLVSFMRDYAFWKDGAARLVCIPSMHL